MGKCLEMFCFLCLYKGLCSLEYKSVSQSSVYDKTAATVEISAALAVDGDPYTFTKTADGFSEYWKILFPQKKNISCFSVILGRGSYIVTVNSTDMSFNMHCDEFTVDGLNERIERCCGRQLNGDSFIISRRGYGSIRLYEVNISECTAGYYGYSCVKCDDSCPSCDAVNGNCCSVSSSLCDTQRHRNKTGNCSSCFSKAQQKNIDKDLKSKQERVNCGWICRVTLILFCVFIKFDNVCEKMSNGSSEVPQVNADGLDSSTKELAILFVTIILVLSITLLLLKRLNVLRNHIKVKYRNPPSAVGEDEEDQPAPRQAFGDEANTIFLQEIVETDDIGEDGLQILDAEYTNTIAHRVSVEDFVKYHNMRRQNNITEEDEFAKIPTGLMELYREAVRKENVSKNRYRYVYPYDFCRVVLDTSGEEGSSDYINACYVEGFKEDRAYIAAQGPFTPETLIDFWKMIWQENGSRIVMLTNLYEGDHMKCLKYWPDDQTTIGDIEILMQSQEENEMYTIRQFTMHQNGVTKDINQFHFTSWPDRGVPDNVENLLHFRDLVKNGRPDSDGPIIVHCSAGIGRTGTFIALDYLLDEGTEQASLDVINCVSKLRQQRAHSIQTKEQYIFLYDALACGLKNTERDSSNQTVNEVRCSPQMFD